MNIETVYKAMIKQARRTVNIYRGPKLLPGDPEIVDAVNKTHNFGSYLKTWFTGQSKDYLDAQAEALKKYPGSTADEFNKLYWKYIDNLNNKAIKVPEGGKTRPKPKK